MNQKIDMLYQKMVEYYSGDPKRIQHFVKVHSFAKQIGHSERLDSDAMFVLEAAALVHDIGIKPSERSMAAVTENFRSRRDLP